MPHFTAEIPQVFEPLFSPCRRKCYHGGRGAGKTQNMARVLLTLCMQEKLFVVILREYMSSIRDSSHRMLSEQIVEMGYDKYFNVLKSSITCKLTGSEIVFYGLSNATAANILSITNADIAWVDQAEAVSEHSLDLFEPSIRGKGPFGGAGAEIWYSMNPDSPDDVVYDRYVTHKADYGSDLISVFVSYQHNPWFPESLRKDMELCKARSLEAYENIWLGKPKSFRDKQIFNIKGQVRIVDFPEPDENVWQQFYGADWGSTDPTVLVKCWVFNNELWIEHEFYKRDCPIEQIASEFDAIPGASTHIIRGDCSNPALIKYLKRNGLPHLVPCKKAKSVLFGIDYLKSFLHINIHPRCKETIDEFHQYSWKTRRVNQTILIVPDEPDAGYDHVIDSLRYALEPLILGLKTDFNDRPPTPELDSLGRPIIPGAQNPLARTTTWL